MNRRLTQKILLLFIASCGLFSAAAQVYCPPNINFEQGSLTSWNFYTGMNSGLSGITGIAGTAPLNNRHTLTSGIATDYYGGFPIVDPVGGGYSLKLGNDGTGSQVDQARYTFTIPANVNNYSLIYRYAVVLENPAHNSYEQPFFKVRVYNSATNATISCASFTYISAGGLPGFSTSPFIGNHNNGAVVYYKPWATASLNLTGQAGNTLVVEFTAADCSLGAHMGYGYVDVTCGLFAITSSTCNPTSPLSAPPGFQTYTWYNADYSAVVGSGQNVTVTTPSTLTPYHVVLAPYPGYGCPDTLHTQLLGSSLSASAGPDTMLCNNPSITLQPTASGSAIPLTYNWTPATGLSCTTCLAPVASPAVATNYVLTVTDTLGCVRKDTVNVKARPLLTATGSDALCYGAASGSATSAASQGTPPFNYSWNSNPVQTGAAATALTAGTYTVTATDSRGCFVAQAATVGQPTPLTASVIAKDSVSCYGGTNGQATAAAAGGSPPYTYSWNTIPAQTSATATNLSGGVRVVTVTDSHGCVDTESTVILQPLPLAFSVSLTGVLCNGGSTGTAAVNATGGTAPYTYAVDAGLFGPGNVLAGLNAGSHTVHLKDAHGCTKDSAVTITQPQALNLGVAVVQPLCNGGTNGSLTLAASGGTPAYQYALGAGPFGSSVLFGGLSAGPFVLHAKDLHGCTKDTSIVLAQPPTLAMTVAVTNVLCNSGSNGAVTITASGGSPAYTYAVDAGAFGSNNSITGLASGLHAIHLKDANNCTKDTGITIAQPPVLNLAYTALQPLCNGAANGSLSIAGSGGTLPYQFALNAGPFGSSAAFTGLAAGTYILHLKDANGCTRDSTIILAQPAVLTAVTSKTNVSCNGGSNGTAQVTAGGGTAPYTYAWTGLTSTSQTVTGLFAGSYTATVTDNHGCTATSTTIVTQPTAVTLSGAGVGPVCYNGSNGSATIGAAGGTSPYAYSWNTTPAQATATASGLTSGLYTATVTDGAGCLATFNVTVPVTPPVVVNVTPLTVSCFGGSDGSASATAVNGNAPYSYSWNTSPAQAGNTATSLSAGSYTVTATSAAGCVGTATVSVPQPAILDVAVIPQPTCPGFLQGSATASANGGNLPYSYQWNTNPVQATITVTGLGTGTYFVMVTDAKGCVDTGSAVVGTYIPPQITAGPDDTVCRGIASQLMAGGAQNYLWSPGATLSCTACASPFATPVGPTIYTVIGTDAHGCRDTDFVKLDVIQHVPVFVDPKRIICEGDSVRLGAGGGIAWTWLAPVPAVSRHDTTPIVKPSLTTAYTVVITENECFRDTLRQEVEVLPPPTVDLGPDLKALIGAIIRLEAKVTNASRIIWSPVDGLSCTDCFSPQFTVRGKHTFIARVENALGCPATDTIHISDICDEHYFYFANMFTPNGDGHNDRFYPQAAGTSLVQNFMIYDRWGEIVFSAKNITVNDAEAGWDGTYKSQQLKPDVYVYVMDAVCENGSKVVLRGDVTLIR